MPHCWKSHVAAQLCRLESLFFMALYLLVPIIFANSLDTDQAQQKMVPDLDLNYLTPMVFMKEF